MNAARQAGQLVLAARDVVLRYGQDTALDGVDISVRSGQFTSLTGASGSGKSSLLFCLAGLVLPTSGEVFFDGISVVDQSDEQRCTLRRDRFGFVFQTSELLPELTLVENVMLPLQLRKVRAAQARARALELLASLGIGHLAGRRPGEVSGGQAQRAAVARAMVNSPAVLFADEPTGALDQENGSAVLAGLQELTRSAGTALVLVTHDESIAALADVRVRLADGALQPALC